MAASYGATTSSNILPKAFINNDLAVTDGTVLHSGVIFNKGKGTPSVHSIQRYYDSNAKLIGILFLEGIDVSNA